MTDPAPKASRRARGDHYCKFDPKRDRWHARASVGFDARGTRIYVSRYGKSQSAALASLRRALSERDKGVSTAGARYSVGDAVTDWLAYGLVGRDESTVKSFRSIAERHVLPHLGAARLADLTTRDVERWLASLAPLVGRATLTKARMVLRRSIRRAMAHELATRNVAEFVELPEGRPGRRSKSFTSAQAAAILTATRPHRMHSYIVVSMLTGARTEEMRALTWDHVALVARGDVPPHMNVWTSVRKKGDTKTAKSRRSIALPHLCIEALQLQRERQDAERRAAGEAWHNPEGYVFTTRLGGPMDVNNVRRDFRVALKLVEGVTPDEWTPRELRHSFVSLLSDHGVSIEEISRLVGHAGTYVTERVYRHQIRPVVERGAAVMDDLFPGDAEA